MRSKLKRKQGKRKVSFEWGSVFFVGEKEKKVNRASEDTNR